MKKQETIEKVANRYSGYHKSYMDKTDIKGSAFLDGYTHALKILYTEEEARAIWKAGQEYWKTSGASITFEELVEQFKKK